MLISRAWPQTGGGLRAIDVTSICDFEIANLALQMEDSVQCTQATLRKREILGKFSYDIRKVSNSCRTGGKVSQTRHVRQNLSAMGKCKNQVGLQFADSVVRLAFF